MTTAPIPVNENERLHKLLSYKILDTPKERDFDEIVELASKICGTPMSLISILDADRVWYKAQAGIEGTESARETSFCGHGIMQEDLFEVADTSQDIRFNDNPFVTGDPNIRYYAGMPLQTSDGHKLGMLCVFDNKPHLQLSEHQKETLRVLAKQVINNMELRNRAREMEEMSRLQTRLLSILGHDFRTPLNSLIGIVDLFRDDALSREQLLQFMDQWEQQAFSINKLLDNIMEWGTSLLNNRVFLKKPMDVHTLVGDQINLLFAKSQLKGNRLLNHVEPGLIVPGDKHMLGFIFRNLLDNANKFTSNGTIEVTSVKEEKTFHLIFKDTGKGLTAEEIDRILHSEKRFYKHGTNDEKGYGLGLALCLQFIRQHGGYLAIESEPGKGSSFHVHLGLV